jgi:UDP-N-acetylglucosamine acyltransferase
MTTATIHPTAVVDPDALIGPGTVIGPYCIVGPHVKLGARVTLKAHVNVEGYTSIGDDTIVFPFASLGSAPQDLKYHNEPSVLLIGKNCKIREHVTMNPGTETGLMRTTVGDNCLFMVGAHVAHDCVVGDNVILANNATLAGHVTVGEHAIIGGLAAVHQFVRVGAHAMIGGMAGVKSDVIPYGIVMATEGTLAGLNLVGLERRGYSKDQIQVLLKGFRQIFEGDGTFAERLLKASNDYKDDQNVMKMLEFINAKDSRSILRPKTGT